ncbi:hypothetical protein DL96DRAFT_1703811 [Flagelloscypha sp. PMI_526]|nr:hypothetical protein DL96DRAFT_1703811 [Flagelloscypha sp. PMI_526]
MASSSWSQLRRNLTAAIPLSSFLYNAFLLINLLHYSTLPSLKIWSWPKTFAASNAEDSYTGWFTLEAIIQAFSLLGSVYLFTAVLVSIVGFIGVLKKQPATIRFYRDCAIADLSFGTAVTLLVGYGAFFFQQLGLGVSVCDELSRNPVIMRSLSIDLENCEQAVERWFFATLVFLVIGAVIRLHCLLFISKFYNLVAAEVERRRLPLNMSDLASRNKDESRRHHRRSSSSSKRVFIVEHSSSSSSTTPTDEGRVLVYTPTSMTLSEARKFATVKEAVVQSSSSRGSRRHHHHYRRRSSVSKEDTWVDSSEEDEGAIALPSYPGEPLR